MIRRRQRTRANNVLHFSSRRVTRSIGRTSLVGRRRGVGMDRNNEMAVVVQDVLRKG